MQIVCCNECATALVGTVELRSVFRWRCIVFSIHWSESLEPSKMRIVTAFEFLFFLFILRFAIFQFAVRHKQRGNVFQIYVFYMCILTSLHLCKITMEYTLGQMTIRAATAERNADKIMWTAKYQQHKWDNQMERNGLRNIKYFALLFD